MDLTSLVLKRFGGLKFNCLEISDSTVQPHALSTVCSQLWLIQEFHDKPNELEGKLAKYAPTNLPTCVRPDQPTGHAI